jgi:PAS domain S-box-containing protein
MSNENTNQSTHCDILVVEDNISSLKFMSEILATAGYRVRPASDGELALRSVRSRPPDLILLDFNLPGMNGIEVCQSLKADPDTSKIPVIFISALGRTDLKVKALEAGGVDYVTKPIDPSELLARIKTHFNIHRLQRSLADQTEKLIAEIEERKQAEKALKKNEEFLNSILESVQDGISVLKPDLTIRHVNGVMNKWYKKNLPLEGKKCYEVYHNADKPCNPCPTLRCLKSGNTESNVVPGLTGSPVEWIELFSYPIKDLNSGKITGVVEFLRDITKRKRAEESNERARSLLKAALESTADGILVVRMDGVWSSYNQKFLYMWKIPASICESGNDQAALDYVLKSLVFPEKFIATVKDIYNNPERESFDIFDLKDGRTFERYSQPQRLGEKIIGRVWSFRDITKRKRAEEEREKTEEQLRHAHKMESVGRLAGGVAHDFNNMLGVILGYTDMALEETTPGQPLHAHLKEICKAAERSAGLTRQLLAFARKQTISPRVLDMNNTVDGMLKMLRRLIGEDIDLTWLPGKGVWPVKVDPSQIDQMLVNLCVNARDAIEGVGKITIETGNATFDNAYCTNHPGFEPGEYMLLSVSDDGCGMGKDILDKIFEPFFTTKEMGQGTGLGLATVYGIVRQNNGFINVYSEPDQGTTFRLYLARHTTRTTQIKKINPVEPVKQGNETILLVEDEAAILKMTTIMLEHQGYTVLAASTPGAAIRLTETHPGKLDLLITDVVMPEMNGRDLAKNILTSYPNLKRLFMSGYTANVIAHHGVLDEGVHFIQKPFATRALAAKVREVLDSE